MSINEQDPKANEPTTFEDAEVEGHHVTSGHSPSQMPEVEAHAIKIHPNAEQPEVEAHSSRYNGTPAKKAEKNRRGFH
jgi:hypothetical protein